MRAEWAMLRYSLIVLGASLLVVPSTSLRADEVFEKPPVVTGESSVSLDDLVRMAEENSPQLRAAAAAVEQARGAALQAGLYPNPQLQGGANQLGGRASQYYATLTQEIVTKNKLQLDRSARCRQVRQAELRYLRAHFDLLTVIRQGYFNVLTLQRRREILAELVAMARRSRQASAQLLEGGAGTLPELRLFEIELAKAEVQLQNADLAREVGWRQLAANLGLPDLPLVDVTGDLDGTPADERYTFQTNAASRRNSLIEIADQEVQRSHVLLHRAKVEPFPNVSIGAGYQFNTTPEHHLAIVQVGVSLPFWNRNEGAIRAARARLSSSIEAVDVVRNQVVGLLAGAVGRYRTASQLATRYQTEILPKAHEALSITQDAYSKGQIDSLRLLQTQRVRVDAELEYVDAQKNRWLAAAEIAGLLQYERFP